MTDILDHLREEVLLCDGAMGSRLQLAELDIEIDYWGQENCSEVLNLSRPDIVREIQQGFVAAGSDILLTNTFGGSKITLSESKSKAKPIFFVLLINSVSLSKVGSGPLEHSSNSSFIVST